MDLPLTHTSGPSLLLSQTNMKDLKELSVHVHKNSPKKEDTFRPRVPDFVGGKIFCDTGNQGSERTRIPKISKSFMNHALWDGKGCSELNGCYDKLLGLPWFSRSFEPPFCEDIQLRVCNDEGTDNERTLTDQIELYVQ